MVGSCCARFLHALVCQCDSATALPRPRQETATWDEESFRELRNDADVAESSLAREEERLRLVEDEVADEDPSSETSPDVRVSKCANPLSRSTDGDALGDRGCTDSEGVRRFLPAISATDAAIRTGSVAAAFKSMSGVSTAILAADPHGLHVQDGRRHKGPRRPGGGRCRSWSASVVST